MYITMHHMRMCPRQLTSSRLQISVAGWLLGHASPAVRNGEISLFLVCQVSSQYLLSQWLQLASDCRQLGIFHLNYRWMQQSAREQHSLKEIFVQHPLRSSHQSLMKWWGNTHFHLATTCCQVFANWFIFPCILRCSSHRRYVNKRHCLRVWKSEVS